MVAALPREKKVRLFASPGLKTWTPLSDFGPAGATGGIWECPDLFELDGKWVLVVNLNPGGPAGGSGGQHFTGRFDGQKFVPDHSDTRWIDYGPDLYATVSFSNTPGRKIWLGWMSNWTYAAREPTTTWRTAQSMPRELRLTRDGRIVQEPVRELRRFRRSASLAGFEGDAYELEATLEEGSGFLLRGGTRVGLRKGELYLDRTRSGIVNFHKDFPRVYTAPVPTRRPLRVRILVDRSSVEVFAGEVTLTARIFPDANARGIEPFGCPAEVRLWRIEP